MIVLFGIIIAAVYLGSMMARCTSADDFRRGVITVRRTAGYIVLGVSALVIIAGLFTS